MSEKPSEPTVVVPKKPRLKSVTNKGLLTQALGAIVTFLSTGLDRGVELATQNADQIQAACEVGLPAPYNLGCGQFVGLLLVFLGWIASLYGRNRKPDLEGLY